MQPSPRKPFDAADPAWIAHRYERTRDEVHLAHVPRTDHGDFPFLTDEYVGSHPAAVMARADAVAMLGNRTAPLHFIFHSAFCASTLLCRAFDRPGIAMGLSEPAILNDIVGIRRRREATPAEVARLLDEAMMLMARPWGPGEAVIVKPSNIINPLAAAMLALRTDSRAVLLSAPLPQFLSSVARKGMWCRLWARELLEGYLIDGVVDLGFAANDYFRQTDLQCAAVGWLAQQQLFADLVERFGTNRVLVIGSEAMLADVPAQLAQIAAHFALDIDGDGVAAIANGPAFRRHSKFGQDFDAEARRREQQEAEAAHGEEIANVVTWTEAVAAAAGVAVAVAS